MKWLIFLTLSMGQAFEKVYCQGARSLQKQKIVSLERACKQLGITRQEIYQRESRAKLRASELAPVKAMVLEIRRFMLRLGGIKLYFLLKPKSIEQGISLGRDAFFSYLRN